MKNNLKKFYSSLGNRLCMERRKMGYSQLELSDEIGVSRVAISNMETGRQAILLHHLIRICKFLGIKASKLIEQAERRGEL